MAKNKKNGQKTGLIIEIISLLLIFLAIFSLISLFGYDPADASWANIPPAATRPTTSAAASGLIWPKPCFKSLDFSLFSCPLASAT